MRSYLFFILTLVLTVINSSLPAEVIANSKKNTNQIEINATVLEELSYKKNGKTIWAETNYEKGLAIIGENPVLTIIIVKI